LVAEGVIVVEDDMVADGVIVAAKVLFGTAEDIEVVAAAMHLHALAILKDRDPTSLD